MNKAILLGRLTKAPEIKYTQSGKAVASFTLAVDRRKGANGEKQADFIACVAWEKTAETIDNYCAKGQQIAVEGRIQTRSYEAKDGRKNYVTEVVVQSMEFCDSKGGGTSPASPPEQQGMFDGSRAVADSDIPF